MARPVSGLTPTELGAVKIFAVMRVSNRVIRFTIEILPLPAPTHPVLLVPLLATTARFRILSTATPVGKSPTGIGPPGTRLGGLVFRSICVMFFEQRYAITAIPVAVLMATAPGAVPTGKGEPRTEADPAEG